MELEEIEFFKTTVIDQKLDPPEEIAISFSNCIKVEYKGV
jgi:hypothetical protein